MSEGNDIRDFSIREGEPETRVQDLEDAEIIAKAGDQKRGQASGAREYVKTLEEASKDPENGTRFTPEFLSDSEAVKERLEEKLRYASLSDESAEVIESATQDALEKLSKHPELSNIGFKHPFAKKENRINSPEDLLQLEGAIRSYEYGVKSAQEAEDYISNNSLNENFLYEGTHRSIYVLNLPFKRFLFLGRYKPLQDKIDEMRKNDATTLGDIKKAQIDYIGEISGAMEEFIKQGKELLEKYNS